MFDIAKDTTKRKEHQRLMEVCPPMDLKTSGC